VTEIAYTERICSDTEYISTFLEQQRIGILGMAGEEFPYAVPVNYLWHDGSIFFHSMGSGRKIELLRSAPAVCFTVFREHGTVTAQMPCHADTAYDSVMVFGRAQQITDSAKAAKTLQLLVDKLLPGYYRSQLTPTLIERYRSSLDGNGVAVFQITPTSLTAKQNHAEPKDLFAPFA
jgi:uncharacterized protein